MKKYIFRLVLRIGFALVNLALKSIEKKQDKSKLTCDLECIIRKSMDAISRALAMCPECSDFSREEDNNYGKEKEQTEESKED